MNKIPGICDPDSTIEVKNYEPPKKHKLVLDFRDGSLSILTLKQGEKVDDSIFTEIQDVSEREFQNIGKPIEDKDSNDNTDIHCDKCDKFYRPYCKLHPLFKIPDTVPKGDKSQPYAKQTLPSLFKIRDSKIPKAGKGVFAEAFIPRGMVFGPYKGVKVIKEKDVYIDGYAWKINGKDGIFYIDGSHPERSNWLRYINSPRHDQEQNMLAFQVNGKVFYRVIKPIRINDELLVWYGDEYSSEFVPSNSLSKGNKTSMAPRKNPFICPISRSAVALHG